ncbi:hypothetical protein F4814DRAFT_276754 [Daldinia grandis]|nr:hypothetical protein F4814DRAFT_276754 [Daldinia grandis]
MSQSTFSSVNNVVVCDACLNPYPRSTMKEAYCFHIYCMDCLQCMYIACYNGDEFAPRCCNTIIVYATRITAMLGQNFYRQLIARRAETNSSRRSVHNTNTDAGVPTSENHDKSDSAAAAAQRSGFSLCNKCLKGGNETNPPLDAGLQEPAEKQGRKSFCKCDPFLSGDGYDSDDWNLPCPCRARPCHNCGEPVDDCDDDYYTDPEIEVANLPVRENVYIAPWRRDGETEDSLAKEATE